MLDLFFNFGDVPPNIETGIYSPLRVVLSYSVAAFASYTTLLLAHELIGAKTLIERRMLHWGGAFAMGAGIWSMHFIGMLSYQMRMALDYDLWLTLLSLLIAIGVAYGALRIVARDRLLPSQILTGGILLGLGICGMHYTGMAAMKMDADLRYIPSLFFASVAIAIGASWVALWTAFTLAKRDSPDRSLFQFAAALLMGGAICGMHYTGMAAAVFIPFADCRYDPNQNFDILAGGTAGTTAIILGIALGVLAYRRGKAEFRLRDSESKLRAVIDNALDALITINPQGTIEAFNPTCEQLFGYSADEVLGCNVSMLMPEPHRSEHDGYLTRYLATGNARIIGTAGRELTAQRKDGSTFPIDLSVSSFDLTNGTHFSGIIRDISARKDIERRLQESTQRERLVIQCALDAIITIDEKGMITEWNEQAAKSFGWSREEAIGKSMAEMIIPPAYRAAHYTGVQHFLTEGVANILGKRIELTAETRGGSTFPVEITVTSQKIRNHYYFTAFVRDITAQKNAEAERDTNLSALQRSNSELDNFSHIVSHDLKEPLRGLFNNASFLLEDFGTKLGDAGAHRLNRLLFLSERMQRLVDDLLSFSRLGRTEMAIQETNPNEIVHDVARMLEAFLEERHAKITIPDPMPIIKCDKVRVTEAFRNLITNAVKYNDKEKPEAEIGFLKCVETAEGVQRDVFYVKDNGIGIAPDFHEEIFRIFKRLQSDDMGKETGTGAGLTFVKKIIEQHGGRIWLKSDLGKGTIFYFTLPAVPENVDHRDGHQAEVAERAA
jgi:two-component system sensor kinase FixL